MENKDINIIIASDHAGYELKEYIKKMLLNKEYDVNDFGPESDDRVDYPDYAHPVAVEIEKNENNVGILICGSGNGINMSANKHQGVRSALCWNVHIAEMARLHNDANIIALPARYIEKEEAIEIVQVFLETGFEGGRHANRVEKIACS